MRISVEFFGVGSTQFWPSPEPATSPSGWLGSVIRLRVQFNSLRAVPPVVRSSSNCTTARFPQLSSRTKFPAKSTSAPSRRLARISQTAVSPEDAPAYPCVIRSRDSIATQPLLCHYSATTTPLLDHYSATTSPLLDHYFTTTGCPAWIKPRTFEANRAFSEGDSLGKPRP